jgi:plastocyanin
MPTSHVLRRSTLLTGLLAGSLIALALVSATASASTHQTLRISARANMVLRFNTARLHARAGRITIVMRNPSDSGMDHGIAISGHGLRKVGRTVSPGHSSSITLTLRRGSYTYYCPVPGHEQAGMKGTLTVS